MQIRFSFRSLQIYRPISLLGIIIRKHGSSWKIAGSWITISSNIDLDIRRRRQNGLLSKMELRILITIGSYLKKRRFHTVGIGLSTVASMSQTSPNRGSRDCSSDCPSAAGWNRRILWFMWSEDQSKENVEKLLFGMGQEIEHLGLILDSNLTSAEHEPAISYSEISINLIPIWTRCCTKHTSTQS